MKSVSVNVGDINETDVKNSLVPLQDEIKVVSPARLVIPKRVLGLISEKILGFKLQPLSLFADLLLNKLEEVTWDANTEIALVFTQLSKQNSIINESEKDLIYGRDNWKSFQPIFGENFPDQTTLETPNSVIIILVLYIDCALLTPLETSHPIENIVSPASKGVGFDDNSASVKISLDLESSIEVIKSELLVRFAVPKVTYWAVIMYGLEKKSRNNRRYLKLIFIKILLQIYTYIITQWLKKDIENQNNK